MKKSKLTWCSMAITLLCCLALSTSAFAGAKDIFTAQKCDKCHAWSAQGVPQLPAAPDAPPDDPGAPKAEDLSKLSAKVTGDKKEYIKKYLNKEVQRDGKAHKMRFKGTPEELETLAAALAQ